MAQLAIDDAIDQATASSTTPSTKQQPSPISSGSAKVEHSSDIPISAELPSVDVLTKTPNLKRGASPGDDDPEPGTPMRSTKRARTARTPAKTTVQRAEAAAEKAKQKAEQDALKATKAAERKAAAEAKASETQRKKQIKQWKEDWEDWVANHQTDEKFSSIEQDCLTLTECKNYFKISADELNCLAVDKVSNPNGFRLAPMKLYKYDEVVDLAYNKQAILAGVLTLAVMTPHW
jgi:hypothetical protein